MNLVPYVAILTTAFLVPCTDGHGRLIEPPSRASAWRYGFDTPHNYNDHELFCGGFTRQWVKNEGKCGICGDAWDSKTPRAHEYGGTYGQGVIVRKYGAGGVINIRVELTASHFGYFEFAVCPDYKTATQECLNKNILKLVKPQEGVDHENVRYFPKEGNKVYEIKYRLPKQTCPHCLLQWRYVAGNNWGNCPNGTGAVGCGPQEEFRACADISITGKASETELLPPEPTPTTIPESTSEHVPEYPPSIVPTPEESFNPLSSLLISVISFLVVSLILFLLFFHFYHLGDHVKAWIKSPPEKVALDQNTHNTKLNIQVSGPLPAPLPPPRIKRLRRDSINEEKDGLDEVDLKRESLA